MPGEVTGPSAMVALFGCPMRQLMQCTLYSHISQCLLYRFADDSQSASPDDCASSSGTGASPRINRFLAREPPDGCEKVCIPLELNGTVDLDVYLYCPLPPQVSLKLTDAADQLPFSGHTHLFKPCVGFRLRPSLGSAFQPIVATSRLTQQPSSASAEDVDGAAAGTDESAQ